MDQVVKPNLTPAESAWVAAYVGAHGPIPLTYAGHPAEMAANGWITVHDAPEVVTSVLLTEITASEQAALKAAAPGLVAGWIALGRV